VRAAYRGRALKFYADVHRTKRNGEGYRITYTTDGKKLSGTQTASAGFRQGLETGYSWVYYRFSTRTVLYNY
jgi:hypothetical protein